MSPLPALESVAPATISIQHWFARRNGQPQDSLQRVRLQRRNQHCPHCRRVTVEPIDAGDACLDRNDNPIPWTSTVVGFSCFTCGHEWPAFEPRLALLDDEGC